MAYVVLVAVAGYPLAFRASYRCQRGQRHRGDLPVQAVPRPGRKTVRRKTGAMLYIYCVQTISCMILYDICYICICKRCTHIYIIQYNRYYIYIYMCVSQSYVNDIFGDCHISG